MLTVAQAAALWGVNKRTVQKWVDEGRLPAERVDAILSQLNPSYAGLDIDVWVILTDKRPDPSVAPIVRPRKERPAPADGQQQAFLDVK
jgi:Helix-turn-helix domain